jgi:hypothetical protein
MLNNKWTANERAASTLDKIDLVNQGYSAQEGTTLNSVNVSPNWRDSN